MKNFTQRSTKDLPTARLLIASIIGLAIVVSTFSTASAAPQTESKPWVSTKLLAQTLNQLANQPPTADWATQTKQLLDAATAGDLTPQQRTAQLMRLDQQQLKLDQLHQRISQSLLPENNRQQVWTQLQQFQYQLGRRIATWSVLASLGDVDSDQPAPTQQLINLQLQGVPAEWSNYLELDDLREAFATQDDEKAKRSAARQTLARIYSPVLQATQADYLKTLFSAGDIQLLKSHASRKVDPSNLANRLELYESRPSSRSGHLLNDVLQDLLWSDDPAYQQAAEVIQSHYRNANFRMTISQAFMNRLLPQLPTIAEPVSETIKGAKVSGRSQVSNELKVALIPDEHQLNFEIQTNGHVQSDTVAKTKAFRIMSQGQANFQVYKKITVSANGIDASERAYSTSNGKQLLVGIQSKVDKVPIFGSIVRRAAARKVREQSPESNQLFRRKISQAAEARVEEGVAKGIQTVRQSANKNLLEPLIALDLEPTPMQLATTESDIVIQYRLAGRDQMSANTARPASNSQSMIAFQLHQSLINNIIARLGLKGESFNSQELADHLQNVLGVTRKAQPEGEQKEAQFKFAAHDPIRIDFEDNRVKIVINLDSLQVSGKAKPMRHLSITAAYAIQADGMQVQLIQDNTGTRVTSRGKRLRIGDRAVVSTVMKMLFESTYSIDALPEQFRDRPQAQSLMISRLVIHNGWLGVEMDDLLVTEAGPQFNDKPETRIGDNLRRFLDRR